MVEVHNAAAAFRRKPSCGQSLPVTGSFKGPAPWLDQAETDDPSLLGRCLPVPQRPCGCLGTFQHTARIGDVISLGSGDSIFLCHALIEPALSQSMRKHIFRHVEPQAAEIAKDRSLELTSDFTYEQSAQLCDGNLVAELEAAARAVHGHAPCLPSGATHDASAMSELCSMAIRFVRCRDGASHLPEEFASEADMEVARRTLSQLVRNLADKYS